MSKNHPFSRRSFFKLGSATAVAAAFAGRHLPAASIAESTIPISDDGWRMWPDAQAPWQDDDLHLPDEVDLAQLPVRPPTGGWQALHPRQGIPVTLPASAEQYYWGKLSSRPYTSAEYEYAEIDPEVINGAYRGVSWFWREFDLPAAAAGRRATLHIRGYRQRVEVFVNQQLAGYDLIAETSYDCDITRFLRAGTNQLALRITNPGGVYDWRDFLEIQWGSHKFHRGRGFGGLDRAIHIHLHDEVYLSDLWVLNTPETHAVQAWAEVRNLLPHPAKAHIRFSVGDDSGESSLTGDTVEVQIPAESTSVVSTTLRLPSAKLWSVESPVLYRMRATLHSKTTHHEANDQHERSFGFRWFESRGIGSNAMLMLNGKRIRLYSAIEFGSWGFTGLWPTEKLAQKDILAAKNLGLNALQYHRNLGKHEEMEQDDRLGLLRYMEPGGGYLSFIDIDKEIYAANTAACTQPPIDTSGDHAGALTWSQRYMKFRVLRMIRDFRSHPALIAYDLQNECNPDLHNPKIFSMLRAMRKEDPSRTIVLHSGIGTYNQAFFLPYSDTINIENGAGYSGWADQHTVGGAGVWQDSLYTDPRHFTQRTANRREISMQGEMLGWAAPDNHAAILESIRRGGGHSYDVADHERILNAYNRFLDKWQFRRAFPSASALFADAGNKLYETWGRILQIIRTDDSSDYLVINGWEDQPIDSHSGLVDNQRNFKGDPELIRAALAPLRPVVQPRGVVHKKGETLLMDLFLLNETNQPVSGTLQLSITDPSGKTAPLRTFPTPAFVASRFAYPIAESIPSPSLEAEGYYTLHLALNGSTAAEGTTKVFVVDPSPALSRTIRAGIVGDLKALSSYLPHSRIALEEFQPQTGNDVAILLAHEKEFDSPQFISRLSELIAEVHAGMPLLVLAQTAAGADAAAKPLSKAGAFEYGGLAGESRGCWMGTWVFLKDHPAYSGLPSNQVMKWEYQVSFEDASGLLVDGPAVEVIAGYGRDHDDTLGAATFAARLGKGSIIFQAVRGMQPLLYERFIVNAAQFLTGK